MPELGQDLFYLLISSFLLFKETKIQRNLKIINSSGTRLIVEPTTYFFFCIYLSANKVIHLFLTNENNLNSAEL